MTELEKWFADPANPRELEEVLNSPLMARALHMLTMMNLPSGFTQGSDMVAQAAHNWHYYAGYHEFHKKLRMLAFYKETDADLQTEAFDKEWLLKWHQEQQANKTEA